MGGTISRQTVVGALMLVLMLIWSAAGPRTVLAVWTHQTIGPYEYHYLNSLPKFRYDTNIGQWWHYSEVGADWLTLSSTARPNTNFYETGAWFALGTGLNYRYDETNNYGFFGMGPSYRFYYRYGPGQWYNSGYGGGWYLLGAAGLSAGIINGGWYALGTGTYYRYDTPHDYGFFSTSSAYRFYYRYGPGQWYTSGFGGGWYQLGAAGRSAGMVNGGWYALGTGLYYRYDAPHDYGFFSTSSAYRFYYRYGPGQWYTSGFGGGWHALGTSGLTAAVLADVQPHTLGNGFDFHYDSGLDTGYFQRGGADRFSYDYGLGQWSHTGDIGTWGILGNGGHTAAFIGDGSRRQALTGPDWWYGYDFDSDTGSWSRANSDPSKRFSFLYGTGQWQHHGQDGGTALLGLPIGLDLVGFFGDGARRDITAGLDTWWYDYNYSDDRGQWFRQDLASTLRFSYGYADGQWRHHGANGGSALLGIADASLNTIAFFGDGVRRDITTGLDTWWYDYNYTDDRGQWFLQDLANTLRFSYGYTDGQWRHHGSNGGSALLGIADGSLNTIAFFGDGVRRDVTTGMDTWWYDYNYTDDRGQWFRQDLTNTLRFSYAYDTGQWRHHGFGGGEAALGAPVSLTLLPFLGSGGPYEADPGGFSWWYQYIYGIDSGQWSRDAMGADLRFSYTYADGQWSHHGYSNGQTTLGSPVSLTTVPFMGAGGPHSIIGGLEPWWYQYNYTADRGQWSRDFLGADLRFSYGYADGQWRHHGFGSGEATLGSPVSLSALSFIGDFGVHEVTPGMWWYRYIYSTDRGYWYYSPAGNIDQRFIYSYSDGQWRHYDTLTGTGLGLLGESGLSLSVVPFVGDGQWHQISSHPWYYRYIWAANTGSWSRTDDDTGLRFRYGYSGTWLHVDWNQASQLMAFGSVSVVPFIGDGAWYASTFADWYYSYNYAQDRGYWSRTNDGAETRFSYAYADGQWRHLGFGGGEGLLGDSGISLNTVIFAGIGSWQLYSSPAWYYSYDYGTDTGAWSRTNGASDKRFSYGYADGQWRHYGYSGGEATLGSPVSLTTVPFMGAGAYAVEGGAWGYQYLYNLDRGLWGSIFTYAYSDGQWRHHGVGVTGEATLGAPASLTVLPFIGNGLHEVVPGAWWYQYNYGAPHRGQWFRDSLGADLRFSYGYIDGEWRHHGYGGGEATLGSPVSLSALPFMGTGGPHEVILGSWWYQYDYGTDRGQFYRDSGSTLRFSYSYDDGQWWTHAGAFGDATVGSPLSLSTVGFVGDGGQHEVVPGTWWFRYLSGPERGLWHRNTGSIPRLGYEYLVGRWAYNTTYDGDYFPSTGQSPAFVGDEQPHTFGYGFDYRYNLTDDAHEWLLTSSGAERFRYEGAGVWSIHQGAAGWGTMSSSSSAGEFIGDGVRRETVTGAYWDVQYVGDVLYIRHKLLSDSSQDYVAYFFGSGYWADSSTLYPGPWQMTGYFIDPANPVTYWLLHFSKGAYSMEMRFVSSSNSSREAWYYQSGTFFRHYNYDSPAGNWYQWNGSGFDFIGQDDPDAYRP